MQALDEMDLKRIERMGRLAPQLAIAHQHFATAVTAALSPLGITFAQMSILTHFVNRPAHRPGVSELADVMQMNQPATTKSVQGLVERGWLKRETDPTDSRRTQLSLTPAGEAGRGEAQHAATAALAAMFAQLDDDELAQLTELLSKVLRV